ncbi:MAG: phospho-sugar mutase [Clostridia bacterium]
MLGYLERMQAWLNDPAIDEESKKEIKNNKNKLDLEDRFYKDLDFGTAGLRGKLGVGTNRMNTYMVGKATQAFADYILSHGVAAAKRGVVIAYDSRHQSDVFALETALVFAGNGIKAYLFEGLRPTPELSFAIRHLDTIAGVVVTASHNPKEYNGYKAYWEDGSQILAEIADTVMAGMANMVSFSAIKISSKIAALEQGLLQYVGKEIDEIYLAKVLALSIYDKEIAKDIAIVYTPLNGTGNVPVRTILARRGFTNLHIVEEQAMPDPDFTTVGYPNPEDVQAFRLAEKLGTKVGAELLIATDPDADRLAVMVRDAKGGYLAINGNQAGVLLVNYLLRGLQSKGKLPKNGCIIKSLVTGDMAKKIALDFGVATFDVLTGFKNICGLANKFAESGEYTFLFGYEESIGYLAGDFVRDKDAVSAAMLFAEMAAYYQAQGIRIINVLEQLFQHYGYYKETVVSIVLEGITGQQRISRMMDWYRANFPTKIGQHKLILVEDFQIGMSLNIQTRASEPLFLTDRSNVLKYRFDDESWYAVRPSGTEPKIKLYIYTLGTSDHEATAKLHLYSEAILSLLHQVE